MPVVRHGRIKEPLASDIIWRYMCLSKFRCLLENSQLYLCRLDKFDSDSQDGAVPERNYVPNAQRTVHKIEIAITGITENGITIENHSRKEFVPLKEYHGGADFEESLRKEKAQDLLQRMSMFASCWHKNNTENPMFWQNYKSEPIVAIKTSVRNLLKSVYKNEEHLYLCDVEYFDEGQSIPSQNGFYQASHKRRQFDFEKEVRLLYPFINP